MIREITIKASQLKDRPWEVTKLHGTVSGMIRTGDRIEVCRMNGQWVEYDSDDSVIVLRDVRTPYVHRANGLTYASNQVHMFEPARFELECQHCDGTLFTDESDFPLPVVCFECMELHETEMQRCAGCPRNASCCMNPSHI